MGACNSDRRSVASGRREESIDTQLGAQGQWVPTPANIAAHQYITDSWFSLLYFIIPLVHIIYLIKKKFAMHMRFLGKKPFY